MLITPTVFGHPIDPTHPMPTTGGGAQPSDILATSGNLSTNVIWVNFRVACSSFAIATSTGASNLYIQMDGTLASASNGMILYGGSGYSYNGAPLTGISILGAGSSGTYSIVAH